jgi:hypothetical protein
MDNFSILDSSIKLYEEQNELKKLMFTAEPFPAREMTPEKSKDRILKSCYNFWEFDKIYFNEEMYPDGYSKPNQMLKDIISLSRKPGVHIVLGPRMHGKTVTAKKLLVWLLLTGKVSLAGTYAETMPSSSNILNDIALIISNNEKIKYDFKPEFLSNNTLQLSFKCTSSAARSINSKPVPSKSAMAQIKFVTAFSEGRSVKGYSKLFGRPQFLLGDDIETLESSMSKDAVRLRIDKITESFLSLNSSGTFLILGNDFNLQSAMHTLRSQSENNLLQGSWTVSVYQAWNELKKKPLWKERYPAGDEKKLKSYFKCKDEADYQTGFQLKPTPPEGDYFKRTGYKTFNILPKDIKGVIYCDPNLSKKGKGNTTAAIILQYSPMTNCYYVTAARCKSFSDSNELLEAVFKLHSYPGVYAIGFDGHVSQESTWTQHARNWCRINQVPFPHIEYKRYKVNDLAKNMQLVYNEGRILFPEDFSKTTEGEVFLSQFFAFAGEKGSNDDDGPDSLICAFEYIHERKLVKQSSRPPVSFNDEL